MSAGRVGPRAGASGGGTAAPPAVRLREPVEADAAIRFSFPPRPELVRLHGGDPRRVPEPSLERSRRWVAWPRDHPFARIIELDGRAVGHVRLHALSDAGRSARPAIGSFAAELVGRGVGRRARSATLDHGFGVMGLHRVGLRVPAFDERAIRRHRARGLTHEGTEREAVPIAVAWHDEWIMGVPDREHRAPTRGRRIEAGGP